MNYSLMKLSGKKFNTDKELESYIEENTDFDVLGIFNDYVNLIDRYEDDQEEIILNIDRDINTIIYIL